MTSTFIAISKKAMEKEIDIISKASKLFSDSYQDKDYNRNNNDNNNQKNNDNKNDDDNNDGNDNYYNTNDNVNNYYNGNDNDEDYNNYFNDDNDNRHIEGTQIKIQSSYKIIIHDYYYSVEPSGSPNYWQEIDDDDKDIIRENFSFLNGEEFLELEEEITEIQEPISDQNDKYYVESNKFLPSERDYNIISDINLLMKSKMFNEKFSKLRDNGDIPLYNGSETSVKDFNDKLIRILRMHHANSKMITSIFETLVQEIPFLNIPCKLSSHGNKRISILDDENNVNKYPDSIHVLTYDACKGGCMVYTDGVTKQCKNDKCLVPERFKPCVICRHLSSVCRHSNRVSAI